jgi:hypothetical protein
MDIKKFITPPMWGIVPTSALHQVRSWFLCSKQWRDAVRVITVALSTVLTVAALLSSTGAHAGGNGLNDKYLSGRAGGRLGIGGTESIKFPKQKSESLRQPTDESLQFPKQENESLRQSTDESLNFPKQKN